MELGGDTKAVPLAAAAMFLWALLLGAWKYRQIVEFFAAVAGYALHGWRRDTDNQFRDPMPGMHGFMASLIAAEVGGWLVLVAGFLDGQLF